MSEARPSFFARIFLAWAAYFRTLFDGEFAAGVIALRRGALPAPAGHGAEEPEPEPEPERPRIEARAPDAAMQLLGLLQREGRFVDFLEEDVSGFSDEEIGAAARVVHDGCKKALGEHFQLVPIRTEEEGTQITLEKGFDATAVRLTGNVVGEAPFRGTLEHRGWRVEKVNLPKVAEEHDVSVIAPAEVAL